MADGIEASAAAETGQDGALDPALLAQVTAFRTRLQASIGEVVLALVSLPRYRHLAVSDLLSVVIEPLTRDRIAIARTGGEGRLEETAGIAIWASVSDEVDAKIREQVQARVFPVRLKPEEWTSGETAWLLDVIAPSQRVATAVLANFRQVVQDRAVRVHPVVAQLVDPAVLERMRGRLPQNIEN
ncbi:toxin-activating lysine-acyltransferase [Methylobacterium platani]|uniref:RTX toxin-activating lysine-acyltransferase n=2 Tax=Methylobacterium platani TaxID=427683 RepID=A0A179S0I5_9HYPH|nr:toxin-activating lysine-acyltransferase [Methylobacterium platani]OAS18098.1 rzcC protein [Methylobacterium platani]